MQDENEMQEEEINKAQVGRKRLYTDEQRKERSREAKRRYAHKKYTTDIAYKNAMIKNITNYRTKIANELSEFREYKLNNPDLFI